MAPQWLDLSGRVAIVTAAGANGGIGHATALALADAGADLFICDIDLPGADSIPESRFGIGLIGVGGAGFMNRGTRHSQALA